LANVFVIRPVAGLIGLLGSPVHRWERAAIAFFGIRGMGSIYYLSYAFNEGDFASSSMQTLWAVTSLTIAISIAVHGITATPFMSLLDERLRGRASVPSHAVDIAVTNPPLPSP
jgi:NhaP-type Na+/H+ or K+/H+ antiporter